MVNAACLAWVAPLVVFPVASPLACSGFGHEAICELAFRKLDDTVRQRVIALIQQDAEFTTFRASCNWPDRPRQRANEHFVDLPRDATSLDGRECPLAEECVVSAIEADFAVLAIAERDRRGEAGGAQVPGALGRRHPPAPACCVPDDRGSNHIRTQGSSCESLHTLWDRCIVEERLGTGLILVKPDQRACGGFSSSSASWSMSKSSEKWDAAG